MHRKSPRGGKVVLGVLLAAGCIHDPIARADTGALRLIDSQGLEYFVNDDITFSTTSSASGAASEADFTTAVAATTMGGGTVQAALDDMFDGAMTLVVSLTGATGPATTGSADWVFYSGNGPATANDACLGPMGAAVVATLSGAAFASSGFTGGEQVSITLGSAASVDVTFMAADQTPADVVSRINAAVGRTVASVSSGAIVITGSAPGETLSLIGVGSAAPAAAIGFASPTYAAGRAADIREYLFAAQTIGDLEVTRRVFVPADNTFMRQVNRFENTGASPITFTVEITNNLGSDANTTIYATSSGDTTADTSDQWVGSFQNWSMTTSTDPRIAFTFFNAGSPTKLNEISYQDGDDNPYWTYVLTLQPGEVKSILNFVTGAGSKASAQATATALLDPRTVTSALACLSTADKLTIVNFPVVGCDLATDTTCDDGNANTTGDQCSGIRQCMGMPIPVDAGVDAGPDAGTGSDAGSPGGSTGGGCGCAVAGADTNPSDAPLSIGFSALAAMVVARRLARRRPKA